MIFTSWLYKNVSQKNCSLYINENYNDWHQKKTTCTFLYIHKEKKLLNVSYKKNQDTLQKARQFPLRFYDQKARQFSLRDFPWKRWSWHLYTKIITFCVTWRFYTKRQTLRKKQDNLSYVFIYKYPNILCSAIFHRNFWNWRRGGDIFI